MNKLLCQYSLLPVHSNSLQHLGASADHLARLYCEESAFRTLWDDYTACQIGLKHWVGVAGPKAEQYRNEYTQALHDLESEIRQRVERSWDLVQDAVAPVVFGNASAILRELRERHGLRGREVYLAPLFPVIEMAWLGQCPEAEAIEIVRKCCDFACSRLGQMAGGADVLSVRQREAFIARFLGGNEQPANLKRLAELGLAYARAHGKPEIVHAREKVIWFCCYHVACCNPRRMPRPLQCDLLQDLAPVEMDSQELMALVEKPVPELLADLEHAWACA